MNPNRRPLAAAAATLGVTLSLVAAGTVPAEAAYSRAADLRVVSSGVGSVSLDWSSVSGAPGYRVRWSTSRTMSSSQAAWFPSSDGTVRGLRPGTTYYFTTAVARSTGAALGPYTPAPYPAGTAKYAVPGSLRTVGSTASTIKLAWSAVSGAPGYRVRWSTSPDLAASTPVWSSTASTTISGLRAGATYYVSVAVARSTGTALSSYSPSPVQVATAAPVVTTPPPSSGGSFDLNAATFNISTVTVDGSAPAHDPWATRKAVVAHQILGQTPTDQTSPSADVVALQEANSSAKVNGTLTQLTDLVATLNAWHSGSEHYAVVPGSSQSVHVVYNDTDLALVRSGVLTWASQETVADGIRSMPWAVFQVRSTGTQFFFSSVHLETVSESIRRSQWTQLIRDVPGLAGGLPVVMGGDFNSPRGAASQCPTPSNPTASVMLPKMGPAGFGDALGQSGCGLDYVSSARARSVVNGNINSVNFWSRSLNHYDRTDWIGQQVDYLFASNRLAVKKWELVVDQDNYAIKGVIPSDHNMVRATITLPGA